MLISRIAYSEYTNPSGDPFEYELDTSDLTIEESATLQRLLEKSGIIADGRQCEDTAGGRVSVGIRLTASGRIYAMGIQDTDINGATGELVEFLRQLVPEGDLPGSDFSAGELSSPMHRSS